MSAAILPFRKLSGPLHQHTVSHAEASFLVRLPSDLAQRVTDAAGFASKTPEALLCAFIEEGFPARVGAIR